MIKLICVGKVKEPFVKSGISEFEKRLRRFEVIEIKDSNKEKEAEAIKSKIKNEKVYLLDEKGKELSSIELSQLIKKEEKDIVFVIGGPDGLSESLKKRYQSISLSKMTFTHEMARLFFTEQLYRAFSILENKKYHRT